VAKREVELFEVPTARAGMVKGSLGMGVPKPPFLAGEET